MQREPPPSLPPSVTGMPATDCSFRKISSISCPPFTLVTYPGAPAQLRNPVHLLHPRCLQTSQPNECSIPSASGALRWGALAGQAAHLLPAVNSIQAWTWPAPQISLSWQNSNHFDRKKLPPPHLNMESQYVSVKKSLHHSFPVVLLFKLFIFIKAFLLLMTIIMFFYTFSGTPFY